MKGVDHTDAIVEDRGLGLDQAIRWQTPGALTDAHRAPRRLESQPDRIGCGHRIIETGSVGKDVLVIRAERTAGQRKLGQGHQSRDMDLFGAKPRPDRIECLKPAKEQRILTGRHSLGQALIEMVMGVHKARRDNASLGLDHLAIRCQAGADLRHRAIPDQQICAREFAPVIVHRDEPIGAVDQHLTHATLFSRARAAACNSGVAAASARPP